MRMNCLILKVIAELIVVFLEKLKQMKLKNEIDDMFGEKNYCHECEFFVGGYCNGEKVNPKQYACLKFTKKQFYENKT